MAAPEDDDPDFQQSNLTLTLKYQAQDLTFTLPSDATLSDLSSVLSSDLDVPASRQKLIVSSKVFRPEKDGPRPLVSIMQSASSSALSTSTPKITLLGTSNATQADLSTALARYTSRQAALATRTAPKASKYISPQTAARSQYTFATIRPLQYLPDPARAEAFLHRLANDRGIRAAMVTHKFSVGLLTEMDPATHTTHDSRTLGLNRNRGEVIELRLRTDAFDGYRDYRTIRKTLCHELTHNVWGDHDARFWKLCGEIEKLVEKEDWASGRSMGEEYATDPGGASHVFDHGGWEGGEYVLGAGDAADGRGTGDRADRFNLSRREIMARAADARIKKQRESDGTDDERATGPDGQA